MDACVDWDGKKQCIDKIVMNKKNKRPDCYRQASCFFLFKSSFSVIFSAISFYLSSGTT